MTTQQTVKIQLVRSPIGTKESHRATVRGLGLRKLNSVSELKDSPEVRGMINKISYLVKIVCGLDAIEFHDLSLRRF